MGCGCLLGGFARRGRVSGLADRELVGPTADFLTHQRRRISLGNDLARSKKQRNSLICFRVLRAFWERFQDLSGVYYSNALSSLKIRLTRCGSFSRAQPLTGVWRASRGPQQIPEEDSKQQLRWTVAQSYSSRGAARSGHSGSSTTPPSPLH